MMPRPFFCATLLAPGASKTDVSHPSSFAIDLPAGLVQRAQRGEASAFEQIYRRFERPVFTLALRLTGQREEAQDVLQDTMLKAFRRIADFRNDGAPFWGWLRQIAVNESLMRLRGQRHEGFRQCASAFRYAFDRHE